ncbi:hypothetical protein DTO027I6_644 [Penicillium roqueforti]|nr:hypothetical protein CBS147333_3429 [Penicillium roqueforti]KAI3128791.1 hypothetical protein CBS147330_5279 [Penicillium roqueforti]KAI3199568.1 hypothetical protein CBS147311_5902 [Penicillium roqueforti]KAI3221744.1 hypothetical protein DTO027I6_644 [Penicillium roqueforti]KAI3223422.1 hypothetical protein DTO012A7_8287 [Penicillium roqueforti]
MFLHLTSLVFAWDSRQPHVSQYTYSGVSPFSQIPICIPNCTRLGTFQLDSRLRTQIPQSVLPQGPLCSTLAPVSAIESFR